MSSPAPRSVGLGGDGDEIAAVGDVEKAFGVVLDRADAPRWHTAGDVYESLLKALPESERSHTDLWDRFVEALTRESGVDHTLIGPDSPLLSNTPISYWLVGLFFGAIAALALLTA